MKLEEIGFYTLSDKRAAETSLTSNMKRCEIILTNKCNFKCPYCRGLRKDCIGDMPLEKVKFTIDCWAKDNLENIRFTGGEPTCYPHLKEVIKYAKEKKIKRIALSTNGSADLSFYKELIKLGVNDYSISLDSCCSAVGKKMLGGIEGMWEKTIENIRELSKLVYLTVGMVFSSENISQAKESIEFADRLGVADIRVLASAQFNEPLNIPDLSDDILEKHPILKYRMGNYKKGRNVRGLKTNDNSQCPLVLDDSAVAGDWHFPCIIYLREKGNPIGKINRNMRKERYEWFKNHNCYEDEICKKNCLDVCIDYNNTSKKLRGVKNGKNEKRN